MPLVTTAKCDVYERSRNIRVFEIQVRDITPPGPSLPGIEVDPRVEPLPPTLFREAYLSPRGLKRFIGFVERGLCPPPARKENTNAAEDKSREAAFASRVGEINCQRTGDCDTSDEE